MTELQVTQLDVSELPVTTDRPEAGSEGPEVHPPPTPPIGDMRPPRLFPPSPERVLDFFRDNLGLSEDPPGSNCTWIGHWYGVNCVPWCAITVSKALVDGGFTSDGETCNLEEAHGIHQTTPRGWAYVPYVRDAFRDAGRYDWNPRPGDLVIFDWDGDGVGDHIGVLEQSLHDGTYVCLEGNTSGNRLERRRRPKGLIAGFCHPPYTDEPSDGPKRPPRGIQRPGLLQRGDFGPEVEALQARLAELGLVTVVDGEFGPQTEAAVREFQGREGIEVDGIVGAETQRRLASPGGASGPGPTPTAPPWPGRYLSKGAVGDDVRVVQGRLVERGARITVDGDFGPMTARAVVDFQRANGLSADGVVGPQTWEALWILPI